MNVTLSIETKLLARARALAHERGTSVNQLIRDYLERLTGGAGAADVMEQLEGDAARSGAGYGGRCPRPATG